MINNTKKSYMNYRHKIRKGNSQSLCVLKVISAKAVLIKQRQLQISRRFFAVIILGKRNKVYGCDNNSCFPTKLSSPFTRRGSTMPRYGDLMEYL
jgi:hypothetical protein